MSASSAPPANTNLGSSNNNSSSTGKSKSTSNSKSKSKSKPKTMKQFKEEDAALEREQRAIEKQIKRREPSVIDALVVTAHDMCEQGRGGEALTILKQVLEKMTKTRGEDHPHTLNSMNNLGFSLGELGRHEEALALFQKTLEKKTRVIGENHLDTITTMNNVACQLCDLDRYEESLDLFEIVLEKRSTILGNEHPATLRVLKDLANAQFNVGLFYDAHQNASRCLLLARRSAPKIPLLNVSTLYLGSSNIISIMVPLRKMKRGK
jgi:tetratricopeptide (TPR) repeat protein